MGIYTCQINLIDELGHKFGFQRAEIKAYPATDNSRKNRLLDVA